MEDDVRTLSLDDALDGRPAGHVRQLGTELHTAARVGLGQLAMDVEQGALRAIEQDEPARTQADATAACQCALELVPQLVARHMPAAGDR